MYAKDLKFALKCAPKSAEVFVDFPEEVVEKLLVHLKDGGIDSFTMNISDISMSWAGDKRVVTLTPRDIVRC